MGKRVHVIKKHEIYGNTEAFNWKSEEFNSFLDNLGCDMCQDVEDCYDRFECTTEDYKRALKLVKAYKKYGRCKKVEDMFEEIEGDIDSFEEYLEVLGGLDKILEDMQDFYKERDKGSDWISFVAW